MSYDVNNPTTEGRYCPMFRGKCPGNTKGCSFWRTQAVRIKDQDTLIQNCLFVLQYEEQYQGVAETISLQQAVQHMNNQVFATFQAMSQGKTPPALSGNYEKDMKVLGKLDNGET